MRILKLAATVAVMGVLVSSSAMAQRPIELGIDAGVEFGLDDPSTTVISLPIQSFRVGFFLSDRASLEPNLTWNWLKFEGEDAVYTLGAGLGLLYHFTTDTDRAQLYVRPNVEMARVGGGGESLSQFQAGIGIGAKLPASNRLALRLEASLGRAFENDDLPSSTNLGLLVGLSFFTR